VLIGSNNLSKEMNEISNKIQKEMEELLFAKE
jgi:hypothetical protein